MAYHRRAAGRIYLGVITIQLSVIIRFQGTLEGSNRFEPGTERRSFMHLMSGRLPVFAISGPVGKIMANYFHIDIGEMIPPPTNAYCDNSD